VTADVAGLPHQPVTEWLRAALPELAYSGPWHAEVISGGLSNITYRLHFPETTVILRRPPLGKLLPSAHDMKREYRVLSTLAPTGVPVPQTLVLCTDPDVLGGPFYVMAELSGDVLRTAEDTEKLGADVRALVTEELIQTLVTLHNVDAASIGLQDYGRPEGFCARQIRRWGEQWVRSSTRELPDMDTLLTGLAERVPPHSGAAIVHGDFRLDNTMIELGTEPRITGVLDWELSTLGDPLADLGMMLTYWHDRGDKQRARVPVAVGVTTHEGFPTSREVAERYAILSGRDLHELPFYLGLSAMKLAVILEGVHSRFVAGQTVSDGYEGVGDAVPFLVATGLAALRG
jgi:aminoglycoside phosphotransferase (APT) family kinase protein